MTSLSRRKKLSNGDFWWCSAVIWKLSTFKAPFPSMEKDCGWNWYFSVLPLVALPSQMMLGEGSRSGRYSLCMAKGRPVGLLIHSYCLLSKCSYSMRSVPEQIAETHDNQQLKPAGCYQHLYGSCSSTDLCVLVFFSL